MKTIRELTDSGVPYLVADSSGDESITIRHEYLATLIRYVRNKTIEDVAEVVSSRFDETEPWITPNEILALKY